MTLYIVGTNLTRFQGSHGVRRGRLRRLAQGIYVDTTLTDAQVKRLVRSHAVRIAQKLYPKARLSHASAHSLALRGNNVLYLSGTHDSTVELPGLTIMVNRPKYQAQFRATNIATREVIVRDELGEMIIKTSTPEQTLLETNSRNEDPFRRLETAEFQAIRTRLLTQYKTMPKLLEALKKLAQETYQGRALQALCERIEVGDASDDLTGHAVFDIAWFSRPVGRLVHDGDQWQFTYRDGWVLPLSKAEEFGQIGHHELPPFIDNLMPEWRGMGDPAADPAKELRRGSRYLSNIAILDASIELSPEDLPVPIDRRNGHLEDFVRNSTFSGNCVGLPKHDMLFEQELSRLWEQRLMPKLSGVQVKAPMHLSETGLLEPAAEKAFTHILKFPGRNGFETLGALEWLGMHMARAGGIETAEVALYPIRGQAPALLIERFDIPASDQDRRLLLAEDLCSVANLPSRGQYKYEVAAETAGKLIVGHSTAPDEDAEAFLKQIITSWVIYNGDLHMKNLTILKTANPMLNAFEETRLSPAYDIICTRALPGLQNDAMALSINGKRNGINKRDLNTLANTIGIQRNRAAEIIEETTVGVAATGLQALDNLPPVIERHPHCVAAIEQAVTIAAQQCRKLGFKPEVAPERSFKPEG